MAFRLYDAASGGSSLWEETQSVTVGDNGLFSVMLGEVNPMTGLDFSQQYYLEITVEGETLSPRHKLSSAGYARRAEVAESVATGSITSNHIADDTITEADMDDGFVARDITPLLHCDGDWEKNLDYLHELPKARVLLQFDGRTDMFRAKEIIGDHCCIFGDVPATMLAFGGKEEVSEYCKKLIDVVGRDGGFILAAGCEIAPNARPENVKAMIDAVKEFGYYS